MAFDFISLISATYEDIVITGVMYRLFLLCLILNDDLALCPTSYLNVLNLFKITRAMNRSVMTFLVTNNLVNFSIDFF